MSQLEVLETLERNEKCVFCRHNSIDELLYGKMYKFENVITHYFCMLFSSNMEQNGQDDEGILGFLPKDVKKEVVRGNKLTCSYCQHPGATIGCAVKSCKKKFHYPCGVQHGSLHLFYGQFRSYCYAHRPTQNVPQSAIKLTENSICVMCQDEVTSKPLLSTIWTPCCKTTWLHRTCVQKMAVNAGYFFKCPNCNNKDKFRKEMLELGIYIPDQDAAWELEPNAYYELTERYSSCDAPECLCPHGRNFSESGHDYEITLCSFCGSQGIHNICGEKYFDNKGQWVCPPCSSIATSSVNRNSSEDPGPSTTVSQKRPNPRRPQYLRKSVSRKRSISTDSEGGSSSRKVPAIESQLPSNPANDTIRLLNSSGEQIEVVRLDSTSAPGSPGVEIGGVRIPQPKKPILDIVQIDSDDDEDEVNQNTNNTALKPAPSSTSVNRTKPKVTPNTAPSIFIDLLDDSDDDEEITQLPGPTTKDSSSSRPPASNPVDCTSTSVEEDEDDDDDVIFVSSEAAQPKPAKEDNSTALIRIVDNDRVYIATPTDIRRGGNLEMFSNMNPENIHTVTITPSPVNTNLLPNDRPMRNFVWQSKPLHKLNDNNFPQPQIISAISLGNSNVSISNNNVGSNYNSKDESNNAWPDVIELD